MPAGALTAWMVSARSSSASCLSCSAERLRMSAGKRTRSSSGVVDFGGSGHQLLRSITKSASIRKRSARSGNRQDGLWPGRPGAPPGAGRDPAPSRPTSVALPASASLPVRLPVSSALAVASSRSSAIWKAAPRSRPYSQRVALRRGRLAQHGAGLGRELDQLAGLQGLQPAESASSKRLAARLGQHVEHLPAAHAARPGGARQAAHQLGAHRRVAVRVLLGQHGEGVGLQRVAGEDRGRLVEGVVDGGLAAAEVVVVHRRQVVVDQGIGVHHLDRRGDAERRGAGDAELPRAFQHQEAAQPLAAADRGVAHGLEQPGFRPLAAGSSESRAWSISAAAAAMARGRDRAGAPAIGLIRGRLTRRRAGWGRPALR